MVFASSPPFIDTRAYYKSGPNITNWEKPEKCAFLRKNLHQIITRVNRYLAGEDEKRRKHTNTPRKHDRDITTCHQQNEKCLVCIDPLTVLVRDSAMEHFASGKAPDFFII